MGDDSGLGGDSMAPGAAEEEFRAGDGVHFTLSPPSSLGGTFPSGMLTAPRAVGGRLYLLVPGLWEVLSM